MIRKMPTVAIAIGSWLFWTTVILEIVKTPLTDIIRRMRPYGGPIIIEAVHLVVNPSSTLLCLFCLVEFELLYSFLFEMRSLVSN